MGLLESPSAPPVLQTPPPPDLFDLAAIEARSENRRKNMALTGFRSTFTGPKAGDIAGETTGGKESPVVLGSSGAPRQTAPAPPRGVVEYPTPSPQRERQAGPQNPAPPVGAGGFEPPMGGGPTTGSPLDSKPGLAGNTTPGGTSSMVPALALAIRNLNRRQLRTGL